MASPLSREFSGPLTMTHVGICTQDGPERKTGEIRFQVLDAPPRVQATLLVAGDTCTYSGKLSDFYSGILSCRGRPGVPLRLWLK
jgi:hypothetical protein